MAPAPQWERASLSVSPRLVVSKSAPLRVFVQLPPGLLSVSLSLAPLSPSLSLSFLFPVFLISLFPGMLLCCFVFSLLFFLIIRKDILTIEM